MGAVTADSQQHHRRKDARAHRPGRIRHPSLLLWSAASVTDCAVPASVTGGVPHGPLEVRASLRSLLGSARVQPTMPKAIVGNPETFVTPGTTARHPSPEGARSTSALGLSGTHRAVVRSSTTARRAWWRQDVRARLGPVPAGNPARTPPAVKCEVVMHPCITTTSAESA